MGLFVGHSGRNRGGRTIGPALRAGAHSRAIRENQLCGCAAISTFIEHRIEVIICCLAARPKWMVWQVTS
jgi:hypothetical protein